MNIYTSLHPTGEKIVAKGAGKQRTVAIDHDKSLAWNHGNAAGEVACVLIQGQRARELAAERATHVKGADKHTFGFPNVKL